jgi:hypothetical protein
MESWRSLLGADRCDVVHPDDIDLACELPTGHGDRHWHLQGVDVFEWAPGNLMVNHWK